MVVLTTNYYIDRHVERQKELDFCFNENLKNPAIDRLVVFISAEHYNKLAGKIKHYNVTYIIQEDRPTFNRYFHELSLLGNDNINIISNLDIIIPEETISLLPCYLDSHNNVLALTRYNIINPVAYKQHDHSEFFNRPDSQDTWIYKGSIEKIKGADYGLGIAGCDNSIAHLIASAGYNITNPSVSLRTYHYHSTEIRNYDPAKSIKPPYKLLTPTA